MRDEIWKALYAELKPYVKGNGVWDPKKPDEELLDKLWSLVKDTPPVETYAYREFGLNCVDILTTTLYHVSLTETQKSELAEGKPIRLDTGGVILPVSIVELWN